MRRVPSYPSYALIGSGRLACHLSFYLSQTEKLFVQWSRNSDPNFNTFFDPNNWERLKKTIQGKSFILLAISDDALPELIKNIAGFKSEKQTLIHFSAAHSFEKAWGLHPLMTFGQELNAIKSYSKIPFCEPQEYEGLFQKVFPGWSNPVFSLNRDQRKYYHACLVAAGNFTSLLWQMVEDRFEQELQLNPEVLKPYQFQIFENVKRSVKTSLTGPLARGDRQTIKSNLEALTGDPLKDIYQSFTDVFAGRRFDEKHT